MSPAPDLDALLPRLRERAADPERRTNARQSRFGAEVAAMDLGGLLSMGRSLSGMLGRVMAANQAGTVDPEGFAVANDLHARMHTPVETSLPAPADEATIEAAEAVLGVALPPAVRRVYGEVADGGFGPGEGLLPLAGVADAYRELRSPGMMPRGREWPAGLLPLVERHPGWLCVEAGTGRVLDWDPEDLTERSSEERFRRSFTEAFASVEAWLDDWLGSRTQAEEHADMLAAVMAPDAQVRQAREARAAIGRMSLEERRAMGLPDVGWEAVVWGGIGWDPDEAGEPGPAGSGSSGA